MIPPLLAEALRDPQLRGAPFVVLCYLHVTLDYGEYQVVKHWAVAQALGLTRQRVSQALQVLVQAGYLQAGAKAAHNVGSYILLAARDASAQRSA